MQQIEQLLAGYLKGAGAQGEHEADTFGTKERSAPPSGIILQHQRQLEKKQRETTGDEEEEEENGEGYKSAGDASVSPNHSPCSRTSLLGRWL